MTVASIGPAGVTALVLAVAGGFVGDPIAFPVRTSVAAVLLLAALGCAVTCAAHRRFVLAAAFTLAGAVSAWNWAAPRLDEATVWSDPSSALVAGRHFVVGYTDVRQVRDLSRRGLIGGVFLTRRNVEGRTTADVAAEIADLQAERRVAGLPPLVVAGDQEGGPVTHLSPPLPPLPPVPALSTEAALPAAEGRDAARRRGEAVGRDPVALGVTMDLAPVVDLKPPGPADTLDRHTRIATRAISEDPDMVAAVASGFARGLIDAGITPTAKHFPALGSVATGTHLFGAALDRSRALLEVTDWPPFRAVPAEPGAAVMLSHASVEAIDPGVPASRSRRVVEGLLRDGWGFRGLAVTDDLTMEAVIHAGLCRAVEGALNAGVDLLLVSWDTDAVYPALRCAARAAAAGRLDPGLMSASAARLDAAQAAASPARSRPRS